MRTTIQRLIQVSNHRSGVAAGFSALRPHKSGTQGSEPQQAPATTPNGPGGVQALRPSRHAPWVHADLLEQEAARRASAPPRPLTQRRKAPFTAPAAWTQKHLRAVAAPAACPTGAGGVGGHVVADLVMTDAPGATGGTALAPDALFGAGGSRAVRNGQPKPGTGDAGSENASASGGAAGAGAQGDEASATAQGETGSGGDVTSSCFGGAGMRARFATRARASECMCDVLRLHVREAVVRRGRRRACGRRRDAVHGPTPNVST